MRENGKSSLLYPFAIADISVTCMGCGAVLWSGAYYRGVIGKLNKLIRKSGWVHYPSEGTLCPECLEKVERGELW